MKIAIIGSRGYPYVYSGYETFVTELAPRLVKQGYEIFVYCHSGLFKDRPKKINGVNLVYIPAIEHKILSQFSHSFLCTLHVLFFNQIDIALYVNSANGPFGIFLKLFGKKSAINVDGLEWLRPKWKGLGAKYFRLASYLSTKFFDKIITDSDRMADIYKKEFNSPSVTIAYGANIGYSENPELIEQFGVKRNEYYLIVGRLIPDNNADIIVKGFESTTTSKKLIILGDVPYKDTYVESVKATKDARIIFPGYIKDSNVLRELYCNAYVYIHGHEFGGTNPALLKALANGCCILALETIFNREMLNSNKHGFYFTKKISDITDHINSVDIHEGKVEEKRTIARARIEENYTWEKISSQYEDLFATMTMSGKSS